MWREVQGGAGDAGEARRFVRGVLERAGIDDGVIEDAVLATSELATNAIRHAGGLHAVFVDVSSARVRIEVEDGSDLAAARRDPGPLETSGRGLMIVEGIASRWGSRRHGEGKVIWFELDRPSHKATEELASDLGESTSRQSAGPFLVGLWIASLSAGIAVAALTRESPDAELGLALCGAALTLVLTLVSGFPAGMVASLGIGIGALVFHRDDELISAELLSLGVGLGGVFVTFFTWAGLQLRNQALAEARLLSRLTVLGQGLATVEAADDPVAEVARLAAIAAEARRAEILPTSPTGDLSATRDGVAVLPLSGPLHHHTLLLHLDDSNGRAGSEGRDAFFGSIAERCSAALERIDLVAAERRARADLEVVSDASRVLVGSLDVDRVTAALRDVLVPRAADELDVSLGDRLPTDPAPRTGEPGATDTIELELRSRSRSMGRLVAVRHNGTFDDDDRSMLTEVAARAAAALDNAVLYAEQLATNRSLEGSLLPSAFRPIEHLDIGARYLASPGTNVVGGDFYDAFPTPDGDMVLMVGDVQGKGVEAATLTALARHTLRAAAFAGSGPAEMLERLNLALRWQHAEREVAEEDPLIRFVTAAVAVLHPTPSGFLATVARGGHPRPILVRPGGKIQQLAPEGTILGAFDDPGCTEVTVDLTLSDTLVLFTDGVVEHRDAGDLFDELQLGRLLRNQLTATGADDLARIILETVVSVARTDSRDDIAILVTRVTGPH